jgi:pimeloyl-ACP methyl ester carboxylesterase
MGRAHLRALVAGLASFARLILHDRRGTGLSSRNVSPPDLETRVADLRVVLDAVGSKRPVIAGALEGGAPNVLFAASDPERVHSIVWWSPAARSVLSPDYPWGRAAPVRGAAERELHHWGRSRAPAPGRRERPSTGTSPPRRRSTDTRSSAGTPGLRTSRANSRPFAGGGGSWSKQHNPRHERESCSRHDSRLVLPPRRVGVRNSDHPCDLRLRPSWPPARDGPIAPSRGPARGTCPRTECG